jgi:uncharacterized protein YkwD
VTRVRVLIAAALTTVTVGAAAPASASPGQRKMIRTINNARALSHHRALRFSRRLSHGASAWANYLMRRQMFSHAAGQQGEIMEWHTGGAAMVRRTVIEWLNSSGHRRVMLGNYRSAGAGKAVGYFGGQRCTIWVVRFAY